MFEQRDLDLVESLQFGPKINITMCQNHYVPGTHPHINISIHRQMASITTIPALNNALQVKRKQ